MFPTRAWQLMMKMKRAHEVVPELVLNPLKRMLGRARPRRCIECGRRTTRQCRVCSTPYCSREVQRECFNSNNCTAERYDSKLICGNTKVTKKTSCKVSGREVHTGTKQHLLCHCSTEIIQTLLLQLMPFLFSIEPHQLRTRAVGQALGLRNAQFDINFELQKCFIAEFEKVYDICTKYPTLGTNEAPEFPRRAFLIGGQNWI